MEEDKVNYKSEYMKVVEANNKMKCDNEELRSENDTLRIEIERLRGDAHSKANQGSTNE